jgi:long-chain acyl-CoA synthetase
MDVRDIAEPGRGALRDKLALVFHDRRYTHGDLAAESARLARGLSRRLAAGELLALWLPNGPELLCLYLACLRTGIIPMPLHREMTATEVGAILRSSRAKVLITSACLLDAARPAFADTALERIYVAGAASHACHDYDELRRDAGAIAAHRGSADSTGFVLHTSGSDGRAKGVMLSWRNLNEILDLRLAHTGLGPDSVSVVASCLTQSVGLHQSLALLAAGGTLVLLEGYDIERMVDAIRRYRPTHLIMVVNAFDRLLHHPAIDAATLASVRFAAVGADRVTRRVQERFVALTGRPLHVSYGMSESSWAIVNLDGRHDKCLALGKPAPGAAVRLVDEQGLDVPTGAIGEIRVRSPRTMLGYLHDPALTRAAFSDGWLRSGDLAWCDDEGYFWFAGRSRNIIVLSSGDNVSPVEIEQAILGHAGVAHCLVAAATAPEDGSDVPCAFVVRADKTLVAGTLLEYLRSRLGAYKLPREVIFVEELPVGPTGKLHRGNPVSTDALHR